MKRTAALLKCLALILGIMASFPAFAVNSLVTYHGTIYVDDRAFNGTGYFKVAIITASGRTIWSNDGTSVGGAQPTSDFDVTVSDGDYTILLGSSDLMNTIDASIFNSTETLYLRTWFDDGSAGFAKLDPDIRITSAIYAINAQTLQGYEPEDFMGGDNSITSASITDGTIVAADIASGAVTTDKASFFSNSGKSFSLGNASDSNVNLIASIGSATNPAIRYNTTTDQWELSNNGSTYTAISTGFSGGGSDIGDILGVTAGSGLSGGGLSGSVTLTLNQAFAPTWTSSHAYTFNGTENLSITSDLAGTVNVFSLVATPSATAATTQGLFVQQANSLNTNGLDSGIVIDNADDDLAITNGIVIQGSSTGVITNAINLSDTEITNAFLLPAAVSITPTELSYLDGASSNIQAQINAISGGDITAVGSMTSGAAFADNTADDDWLGLGVAAGRIEFDDQATDEVNILAANVGIGTQTPNSTVEIYGATGSNSALRLSAGDTSNLVNGASYANTYGTISALTNGAGGLNIGGVSSDDTPGIYMSSAIGTTASTVAAIKLNALATTPGTGAAQAITSSQHVFQINNMASPLLDLYGNAKLQLGSNGFDGSLALYSEQGATDYTNLIQPNAAMTQDVTYTLPADDGAASTFLMSDGAGALSWTTVGTTSITDASLTGDDINSNIAGSGLVLTAASPDTLDIGAGTGISVAADSVAVDQTFTPTWTGAHTFNNSTTTFNAGISVASNSNAANATTLSYTGTFAGGTPLYVSASSAFTANDSTGYGERLLFSDTFANGGTAVGLLVANSATVSTGAGSGNTSKGIYVTNNSTTEGGLNYGMEIASTNAGTNRNAATGGTSVGIQLTQSNSDNPAGSLYGIIYTSDSASSITSGQATGIDARTSVTATTGATTGAYIENSSTHNSGAGTKKGIYSYTSGDSLNNYGIDVSANGTSGTVYGINSSVSSNVAAGTTYGILSTNGSATAAGNRYGIYSLTTGATVATQQFGVYVNDAGSATTSAALRVQENATTTNGTTYGMDIDNDATHNTGAGTKYGIDLSTSGESESAYGMRIIHGAVNTSANDTLRKYGLYLSASGDFDGGGGAASKNYGLYVGDVSGADNNYQAVFEDSNGESYMVGIINTEGTTGGGLYINTSSSSAGKPLIIDASGSTKFDVDHSGNTTIAGNILKTPPAQQLISDGNTVTADACGTIKKIRTVDDALGTTTDTTNTFTAPAGSNTGCCMNVVNVGGVRTVTLDNNANFRGIGNADVNLAPDESVQVCSDGTIWRTIGSKGT